VPAEEFSRILIVVGFAIWCLLQQTGGFDAPRPRNPEAAF